MMLNSFTLGDNQIIQLITQQTKLTFNFITTQARNVLYIIENICQRFVGDLDQQSRIHESKYRTVWKRYPLTKSLHWYTLIHINIRTHIPHSHFTIEIPPTCEGVLCDYIAFGLVLYFSFWVRGKIATGDILDQIKKKISRRSFIE